MTDISATVFKAKCLELMDRVSEHQETYVITKRGKPVAKLVPLPRKGKDSLAGWLRAYGTITGDILGPVVSAGDWERIAELHVSDSVGAVKAKRSSAGTGKIGRRAR